MRKHGTAGGLVPTNSLPPLPTYKTIKDDPHMGLDNKPCTEPVAFCRSKQVYLSLADLQRKSCKVKPTLDMIGTEVCNRLEMLERN